MRRARHLYPLRGLVDFQALVTFLVGCYLGLSMLLNGNNHFNPSIWTDIWELPHAQLVWGLVPLVSSLVGLTGLVAQHHWTVVTGCLLGSLWAFVLGCFMWVTVFTDTAANPWWPGIMWFLALHYTLLGMSFTERYLLPRTP